MIYGATTKATDFTAESLNSWKARLVKALLFFVPRANPDVERLFPLVKEWALELSDDGWPQREVGLDQAGKPLFAIPDDRNTGFWTDMAHQQFQGNELRQISAEEFERLWLYGSNLHVRSLQSRMDYQLLSAAERDSIVASHLREHLPMLGLTERAPRSWIDGSQAPCRRLFEIDLLKGAGMKACYGFSLDFVPHISGGRVRWHRTDKSAMLDVILDPRDLPQPSFIHGVAALDDGLRKLLPEAVARARAAWRRGTTLQGMLDIVLEIRDIPIERRINCFGFHNYVQLPLAFAFLSAKTGDVQTAEEELGRYATSHRLDDKETAKLLSLARDYGRRR